MMLVSFPGYASPEASLRTTAIWYTLYPLAMFFNASTHMSLAMEEFLDMDFGERS